MICDPHCSERSTEHGQPDLRPIQQDDGRIAALEAQAEESPQAAYDLALRLFRGDGVTRDTYKALTWMRTAAQAGDVQAQKALGQLYLTGLEEMGSDPREAHSWLSAAAGQGDQEAAELLVEAEAARRDAEAERRWIHQWRPRVYNGWYRGYPYYGIWNGRYWLY